MADSFPRQQARTRRFTLGAPRDFTVAGDGSRVAFLRSPAGDDPQTGLWVFDLVSGTERLVADPTVLLGSTGDADSSPEERARRERSREMAGGITTYAADADLRRASFALGGRLWWADLINGEIEEIPVPGPVFDPRPDPTGHVIAYCSGGALWTATAPRLTVPPGAGAAADAGDNGSVPAGPLLDEDNPDVTWGLAEFIAAEEMRRSRGYWWSPDGSAILAARVDNGPVGTWWISDPARPEQPSVAHRYPAAGTADADVSLHHVTLDGDTTEVVWNRIGFPYLVAVSWTAAGPPLLLVESRDHLQARVLSVEVTSGVTTVLSEDSDQGWVERPPGLPAWLSDGRLVWATDSDDTRRLLVDGRPITPPGLQVRAVIDVGDTITFTASEEPTEIEVWQWFPSEGSPSEGFPSEGSPGHRLRAVTAEHGVASAAVGGATTVVSSRALTRHGTRHEIRAADRRIRVGSRAERPVVDPQVEIVTVGERQLRVGVVFPSGHAPGQQLPVLLSPYGGPSAQMVLAARPAWLEAQWLADQGFAVVVADGRGSPGRGSRWERAIKGDLATVVLEDQVAALQGAAERFGDLDTGRVAIRGWSFGGYLAALAVLRRPDVFHAAVAGAPVTEWRLYDTYYTERYLGHPESSPEAYAISSLLDDASSLTRPLLLIHGLADDNVVAAHTLLLSQRLLEAGRPHQVLPLTGVTHVASQEQVAENLLRLQVLFLHHALADVASPEIQVTSPSTSTPSGGPS